MFHQKVKIILCKRSFDKSLPPKKKNKVNCKVLQPYI